MNPYKDLEESSFTAAPHLTYEDIATKLLKDHYFLTALELHTELVESGKELPQLREFFSNPGNFEQHVSRASEFVSMHRSPSQATLDSLDTARYSEDGGGDRGGSGGDVAVLEFELRKAKETIHSLRANLTQFADGESALDKNSKDPFNKRSLKPHERRALNFLINEYLLLQDYKLTSITFSDENPDQDFEDWDDVGLNMPRPSGLVTLFWGNSAVNVPKTDASTETDWQSSDMECQTECDDNVCVSCQTSFQNDTDWNHEILIQAEEIELLKQKIILLETEKLNFQKLYDAAIVSLNSLTSPASESKGLELHIPEDKVAQVVETIESRPLPCTAMENHYGSGQSTHSVTPDQFEMIDSEKNSAIIRKEGSNTSSFEPALIGDVTSRGSPTHGSVTTLDDTLSMNDAAEWTRVHYDYDCKEMWIDSGLPNTLKLSLINWCSETLSLNEPLTNDLLAELVNSEKPVTLSGLLTLVADTMPKVLPHTLVARRCEAAALLASCAALLPPGDARRARTLQTLLTLVKKPEPADTRAICEASCLIVKWGGAGEVLSSIAELLASRSTERRILASQICVAIAPYVPIELCTSLLLSLVTLMCESSELEIRSIGLKSACLICPVAEHKYGQLENLMFSFLKDPVDKNVKDAVRIFVPLLARSALISGKFSSELFTRILSNLIKASKENESKSVILYLEIMRVLVLSTLAYVANVQIVREVTPICDTSVILQDVLLESENDSFMDLQCYFTDNVDGKGLLVAMNSLVKKDVRWAEVNWFIDIVKQILEIATNGKALNHPTIYELLISLFSSYVDNFGAQFTLSVLAPIFMDIISDLELKMEKLHSVNVDYTVVVGVYLVALLPAQGDLGQQAEFLQKWIVYSSIRGLPVKMFSIPLKWTAKHRPLLLESYLQHLREFTAHSSAGSRVYTSTLLAELLSVCDVDEGSIERQLIPTVMALLNDDDASVRESAITCWGSVTRACLIHSYSSEAQCWPPMEQIISTGRLSVKEVARAAEALALLVLPTAETAIVSERAVSLLCTLAGLCTSPENVCALTPGLQLAAHHAAHHPALLPALRKLEEIVQTPGFTQYKPSIEVLLHNVTGAALEPPREPPRQSNMAAAQEVGRRVSLMFQQKTNMMPNIFKKKT
ncbi:RAB11-binding protein RELCH homolog isoform X3 [Leguminivora glycinivorella]|uniref:RAB11-binding protein RELCH homolog isoform X3 n=1 Tax=Leguminivora glycinivorella TaxID=1035111 RepID=UPI00200E51E9|nr:RAB11-binding protein RELCH homolog isoform X3 [Leguminivora glycinivorella]